MEGVKGTVCITGGAGYIASWLIQRLLQQGYSETGASENTLNVFWASVSSSRLPINPFSSFSKPEFEEDVNHLKILLGASEKLQIFEANLDKPDSFEPVTDGCIGVFHVAHPIDLEGKTPLDTVLKTSVVGTLGILKACLNCKMVRRVIYTSFASGCFYHQQGHWEIEEKVWTDVDFFRAFNLPGTAYAVSKTIIEREVLPFADEHGLDVVTVLPSMVVGPFMSPKYVPSLFLTLVSFPVGPCAS
uniref:NAD-dependent epimerase/dehydratase domain-containing protein n=1 Tax=Nelumbo nucifera TaxID=4432 RepID=A0A822XEE8_NELNU|nr:TPA_asm: hypothetical protein HUJ06_020163 [Nelumbo nucifera]